MVVVIGAGIAGVSTAYYLTSLATSSKDRLPITLVDAVGPAACSSGKAGAFLTSTWQLPKGDRGGGSNKRESLFRESFALHQELAKELALESYFPVSAFRVSDRDGSKVELNGEHSTFKPLQGPAAMIDPAELTTKLFDKTLQDGNATLQKGFVLDLELTSNENGKDPRVTSIILENGVNIALGDREPIVIAMGPWSSRIEDWLDTPLPIDGVSSTSLLWNDIGEDFAFDKTFFCDEDENGCHLEIFPRITTVGKNPNHSLYVSGCGESDVWSPAVFRSLEAPDPRAKCLPNQSRATAAQKSLKFITSSRNSPIHHAIASRSPDVTQACIRPTTPDGMPVVGKLLGFQNVYVCSGGGPWGITWGPLLGLCLARQILSDYQNQDNNNDDWDEDLDRPIRVGPLKPSRFDTLLYRSLQQQRGDPNACKTKQKKK